MNPAGERPGKAAFEIGKGPRQVMTLSESDVERCLDPGELLDGLEDGFRGLELGEVQSPPRPALTVPGKGFCLAMPSWRPGLQLTIKIVNVFDGNLANDLPNHLALINLFDPDTGATTCVMDGTYITGIRTAASAVLSARLLSRASCRVATVDRRRRPGARAPATAAAGSHARSHQRVLAAFRGRPEACGTQPHRARGVRRGVRRPRVGHRVPGHSLACRRD